MTSVWPSGTDFATISVPILPPAPARLSTMNCCPSRSVSFCAVKRAIASDVLPLDPVTMRTGREGYLSTGSAAYAAAVVTRNAHAITRIISSPPLTFRHAELRRHPVRGLRLVHVAAVVHDVVAAFHDVEHLRSRHLRGDAFGVRRRREAVELAGD